MDHVLVNQTEEKQLIGVKDETPQSKPLLRSLVSDYDSTKHLSSAYRDNSNHYQSVLTQNTTGDNSLINLRETGVSEAFRS